LLVAANRLGTVNHCALTARVADAMGIAVVGFVLSAPSADRDASAASNADTIARLTGLDCLGEVAHLRNPADAAAALRLPASLLEPA
jgi:dethiobiotin synthetase